MVELIIDGQIVDLSKDTEIELTISINDIRNVQTTNTAYSKTISLPGTDLNNKIFNYWYENNIETDFNPNLRKNAEIRVDSLPILTGYVRLNEIDITGGNITYDVVFYGDNTSIFLSMNENLLSELDLSEYDHIYSKDNISATWESTSGISECYYYPVIRYGDYKWNLTDYVTDFDSFKFFPAIYCKKLMDKIFETYGYTYDSNFFNSNEFKSLIIPFTNDYTTKPVEDVVVENGQYARYQYALNELAHSAVTSSYTDKYNIFTPVHHVCGNQPGMDSVFCDYWVSGQLVHVDYWMGKIVTPSKGAWIIKMSGRTMGEQDPPFRYENEYRCDHFIIYIYTIWEGVKTEVYSQRFDNPGSVTTSFEWELEYEIPEIYEGRELYIKPVCLAYADGVQIYANNSGIIYNARWTFKSTQLVFDNSTIKSGDVLPEGLKQKDFFNTIVKMFNLYIERNPTDPNNLTIEPFDSYYSRSQIQDWTYKVDMSSKKYKLMSELNNSSYYFTYTKDEDYWNNKYQTDTVNKILGETRSYTLTDFIQKEEKVDIKPSPTCNESLTDMLFTNINFPALYKENQTDVTGRTYENINTKFNWRIISKNMQSLRNFLLYNNKYYWEFPTASHIIGYNGYVTGTGNTSLMFETADVNYTWTDTGSTTLFDRYWLNYINLIKNQNSKLLTMNVFLSEYDVANIRFYNKIFIDDSYYYLNKLVYSPTTKQSQVELLLVPSTDVQNIAFSNYRLDFIEDEYYSGETFSAVVDIKNYSQSTYNGVGQVYIVRSSDEQTIYTSPFNYSVRKNELISHYITGLTINEYGNFKVYISDNNNFNQYISLLSNIQPFTYSNLRITPNTGVLSESPISISFDITSNENETNTCEGYIKLNNGTPQYWTWTSTGQSSTTITLDTFRTSLGVNTFTLTGDYVDTLSFSASVNPLVSFTFRPMIGSTGITSNFSQRRPDVGTSEIFYWYVDYENLTDNTQDIIFNITARIPGNSSDDIFNSETIQITPYSSGTTLAYSIYSDTLYPGTALMDQTYTCICISSGVTRGQQQITNVDFLDTNAVINYTFKPTIGSTVLTNNSSYQRPNVGSQSIIHWYVDYLNTTQYTGNVYWSIVVNTPYGSESFNSFVITLNGNDNGTTERNGYITTTIDPGVLYNCSTWTITMFVNGVNKGSSTITGVTFTASPANLSAGGWSFTPSNPNYSVEQGNLVVNWTINNNGYSSATGKTITMDMYHDSGLVNKAYATKSLSNQTIAVGGSTFQFTYSNLPDGSGTSMASAMDMYMKGELAGSFSDTPITEGYYPFYIQPCPDDVSSDISSITANATGGTTTVTSVFEVWNNSCHTLQQGTYTIRYTYYSDYGTTVYGYDYPTTNDIEPNDYILVTESFVPPSGWTTGTKMVKCFVNINGEGYEEIGTGEYNYYNVPVTASNFVVTGHSMTYSNWVIQQNIQIKNNNGAAGSIVPYYVFKQPNGTVMSSWTGSAQNINPGQTVTVSKAVSVVECVNGLYRCDFNVKYNGTDITSSSGYDTYNLQDYNC
jgi:hypothetical protein